MQRAEYTFDPPTDRGRARRDRIIAVATELFHERGFYATGIDDIGTAAGITGPGVYRHFGSKDEILIAVLDRIWMMLRSGIDDANDLDDQTALELFVDTHVRLSVERRAEFSLLVDDLRFLPDSYQDLAHRNSAIYCDAWCRALRGVRPRLAVEEANLMIQAAWRISAGSADAMTASGRDDEEVIAILRAMVWTSLVGSSVHG